MSKRKILFGTSNPSKVDRIRSIVRDLPIEIVDLKDLNINIHVEEDGRDVHENAYKKAIAYYNESKIPTFSIDSGLYIEKFPEEKQPGLFVRRINGKRATDDEMLEYYSRELEKVGGESEGKWVSSITFVIDENNIKKHETVEKRYFTAKASSKRKEGWPLSSLEFDPTFKKYVSEITESERQALREKTDKKLYNIFKSIIDEI